jgi:hypothetical protein
LAVGARPTLVRKVNADDKRQAAELIELGPARHPAEWRPEDYQHREAQMLRGVRIRPPTAMAARAAQARGEPGVLHHVHGDRLERSTNHRSSPRKVD